MFRVFRAIATAAVAVAVLVGAAPAGDPWQEPAGNVYFGDLHVHTNLSLDAYIMFMAPGNYPEEAGMYATHCSKLDFYAVTDHAEAMTRADFFDETVEAAQKFNRYGAEHPDPNGDPAIVAFTGWEWTQQTPWGHKNVILKYDDPAKLPPEPIRCYKKVTTSAPRYWVKGPGAEYWAEDPETLYKLVEKYCTQAGTGCEAIIIPHGNAWGHFTMRTNWDIQLNPRQHDPELQRLIEVYSKHGNSEEYRYFPPDFRYYRGGKEVEESACSDDSSCQKVCQEPTASYVPCCWQAGEIVKQRCEDPESEFCKQQIELARREVKPFADGVPAGDRKFLKPEYRTNPDEVKFAEWGVCGQCKDCYQPAYDYHPNSSVQYALASAYFDENGDPYYYRFGFINSTDTHQGRPGSVIEEKKAIELSIARGGGALYKASKATGISAAGMNASNPMYGYERIGNYMNPGGLVAVLADHRNRDDLFESLYNRHVYGTSGARIEVWLRAEVREKGADKIVNMGDITSSSQNPTFFIKANGALKESGTCSYDEHPEIQSAMSKREFEKVCFNECYAPTDERTPIARIEVVKIRQPLTIEETKMQDLKWSPENPGGLIMDPYDTFELGDARVDWSWTDEAFSKEDQGRSVAYYFRIIQEATPGYNCRPTARLEVGKTCDSREVPPDEVSKLANPQDGSQPKDRAELGDTCYSDEGDVSTYCEERAWTSPIYIVKE